MSDAACQLGIASLQPANVTASVSPRPAACASSSGRRSPSPTMHRRVAGWRSWTSPNTRSRRSMRLIGASRPAATRTTSSAASPSSARASAREMPGEPLDLEAERDHLDALRPPDPAVHELLALLLAEHDRPGRGPRRQALGGQHRRRHPRAEVALEDVAVEGMDAARHAQRRPGQPAQQARLRLVRVDDVGPVRAHQPHQAGERTGVVGRPDRAPQRREVHGRHVDLGQVHLGLVRLDGAVHQQRLPALAGEAAVEQQDVRRGAADGEPGDHAQDPTAHQAPRRSASSSWRTVSRASRR